VGTGRPPEDDIAACTAYFELLVAAAAAARSPADAEAVRARAVRLLDPANWAMLANAFAARGVRAPPAVAAALAAKVLADPPALEMLPPHYLAAFAWGLAAQLPERATAAGGAPAAAAGEAASLTAAIEAALAAIAARAAQVGALRAPDHANMAAGLARAGLPMPAVKLLPDEDVQPLA